MWHFMHANLNLSKTLTQFGCCASTVISLTISVTYKHKLSKVRDNCVASKEPSTLIPPNCHARHQVSQTMDKKDTVEL